MSMQVGGSGVGGGKRSKMEHSRTALPTCYRILYYYGDFPVALGFTQTVREQRKK